MHGRFQDKVRGRLRRRGASLAGYVLLLVTSACIVAAPSSGASRPLLKITGAPPARTSTKAAVFHISSRAKNLACRRDRQRYRPCRKTVRYTGLAAGPHTFTARARHGGRTRFVRHRWTVVAMRRAPVAPPAALVPNPGTPAVAAPPIAEPSTAATAIAVPATVPPAEAPPSRRLRFADEFNGMTLNTDAWDVYDGPGNAGNGLRRPSAFELDGRGNLVVTAQTIDGTLVSGGMGNRMNFTYGRVEFRVKTETDPTGNVAGVVLTWPQQQWAPEFTENDMYETGPIPNNNYRFDSFIHFGVNNWQKWKTHDVDPTQWHTIAMEWYPDMLEIYVDNELAFRIDDPAVIPDVLHHVCIQLDATAVRTIPYPVRMTVDYIRVYE